MDAQVEVDPMLSTESSFDFDGFERKNFRKMLAGMMAVKAVLGVRLQ